MPLSQDAPAPYAPTTAIVSLLERSRTKGLPPTIDKEALLRMGVSESLAPRTLQALQILDLVKEDGGHTETLERLRVAPEAEYKNQMAEWLNAAYADILHYVNPEDGDEASVRDAFRPYKPHSMQDRMLTLFTGLYGAAGIWPEGSQKARVARPKASTSRPDRKPRTPLPPADAPPRAQQPRPADSKPAPRQEMSEKALEYRLVDLMSEAAGNPEVMTSIINVITFLKTKDANKAAQTANGNSLKEDD